MANEAELQIETHLPLPFTVDDGTGIEMGALLKMTDPMTAAAATLATDAIAGIAATEKIASDGKTKIGVYRGGIFKVTLSGACAVGDPLSATTTANMVAKHEYGATTSGSRIVGIALETGATGETIKMELNPTISAVS